jgi:hypothetical protein
MIAVISHSQAAFDQVGNSLRSPQLGSVPMGHGSLGQEMNKLFLLFQGQSRGPSWRRLGFQCLLSTGLQGIAPPHNAARMATYASGNLIKRQLELQKHDHATSTLLQQFWRSFRPHRDTPIKDISIVLHYLCGSQ